MPGGRYERLPELATELVELKVAIIVSEATPAAVAAKNATATRPIVGISLGDPVGFGLVPSLARPGGNITGLSYSVGVELIGKQLDLIREIAAKARRLAVLSNPANPFHASAIRDLKNASRPLAVQLRFLEARTPIEFDGAFVAMVEERLEALVVVPDQMFQLHRRRLADLAARSRLRTRERLWPVSGRPTLSTGFALDPGRRFIEGRIHAQLTERALSALRHNYFPPPGTDLARRSDPALGIAAARAPRSPLASRQSRPSAT